MNFRKLILTPKKQFLIFSIMGILLVAILETLKYFDKEITVLPQDDVNNIITNLIQLNTVTVGLLTAFFFFWMQGLDSKRQSNYLEFKSKVDKLIEFRMSITPNLKYLEKPVSNAIQLVASTYKNDFPYQEYQWNILQKSAKKIIRKSHKNGDIEGNYVTNILADLEFYASEIGICFIELTIAHTALISIKKQVILIISLLLMIAFSSFFHELINLNILIGIVLIGILMSLMSLLELYTYISDYYRELDDAWHTLENEDNDA